MQNSELKLLGSPPRGTLEQQLEIVVAPPSGPTSESPCLFLAGRSGRGRLFPLKGKDVLIGRSAEAQVCLDVPSVSNRHTRLFAEGGDWWLEDLGSTNGTFLNGTKLTGAAPLRPGCSIGVGDQRLLFLAAGLAHEQTLFLSPDATTDHIRMSQLGTGTATATGSQRYIPLPGAAAEEDPIAMAFRVVRLIRSYIAHYSWLAILLICLGAAGGVIHSRLRPPSGSAAFDIALKEEAGVNPVEEQRVTGRAFFTSAQSVFTSLPLIRKTLADLNRDSGDASALAVQENLVFERDALPSVTWRGEYTADTSSGAVLLLQRHLSNYLETEIEKALQVFRAQTEFLSAQLKEAEASKREAEGRFVAFREQNPGIEPGTPVEETKEPAMFRRTIDPTRLRTTAGQLATARHQLSQLDPFAAKRLADAAEGEKRVAEAQSRLRAARERGLGDRHPEMVKLQQEVAAAQTQLHELRTAKTSDAEKRASPEYQRIRVEVERLEVEAKAVNDVAELARESTPAPRPGAEKRSRPQLEAEYLEAAASLESAQQLHATLLKKFKAAELQLQLERATAEAHYDLISPPTGAIVSVTRTAVKRALIGGGAGLILTLLIAGSIELRRLAARYAA